MKAILTGGGGQTGPHTLRVITEGVDKPDFQMIRIAGYITTNGVHVACKELESVDPRIRNGVDYILFQLLEQKRVTTIFIG